jgi:YspA, cpYpsA-related SLOG family
MKVIVCGGRDYSDRAHIFSVLDAIHAQAPITILMHGNARGADSLADEWAAGKVKTAAFTPAWEEHGRAAGPLRNQEMLDAGPDLVIAFPGGRGTADMVKRAKSVGVEVRTF